MAIRDWLARPETEPGEDYGFFGPDSVTWKVWSYPTSLSIGFQRAVVIEELDPALVAAGTVVQSLERDRDGTLGGPA